MAASKFVCTSGFIFQTKMTERGKRGGSYIYMYYLIEKHSRYTTTKGIVDDSMNRGLINSIRVDLNETQ
jgi:hypothetical protein